MSTKTVSQYIWEGDRGRETGPGGEGGTGPLSPFGVIPKKDVGKWRLIVDLSHPEEASINDGIDKALVSISYVP